jgi:serine/threonine-protein kinase RsbW
MQYHHMTIDSIIFAEASLSDLAEIRQFIEEKSLEIGSSDDIASDLVLAVNEGVTNIIIHGYESRPGFVAVSIERDGADIIISLRDMGASFDPNSISAPDTTIPLEMRKPGGMGIHMMRSLVDEMKYQRTVDGESVLKMVKRRAVELAD